MLTKGVAICIRFNAWSSRAMGDVDIYVPLPFLEQVCGILTVGLDPEIWNDLGIARAPKLFATQ